MYPYFARTLQMGNGLMCVFEIALLFLLILKRFKILKPVRWAVQVSSNLWQGSKSGEMMVMMKRESLASRSCDDPPKILKLTNLVMKFSIQGKFLRQPGTKSLRSHNNDNTRCYAVKRTSFYNFCCSGDSSHLRKPVLVQRLPGKKVNPSERTACTPVVESFVEHL